VSEVALDDPQVDAVFEEMRRIGVSQCMHRGLLADVTSLHRSSQAGLEARARNGAPVVGEAVLEPTPGGCGEQPVG
jgi:hypothetical protein